MTISSFDDLLDCANRITAHIQNLMALEADRVRLAGDDVMPFTVEAPGGGVVMFDPQPGDEDEDAAQFVSAKLAAREAAIVVLLKAEFAGGHAFVQALP